MNASLIEMLIALDLRDSDEAAETVVAAPMLADLATLGLCSDDGVVSAKGKAYISALESVPLPVQRWVVPPHEGYTHAFEEREASSVHGSSSAQPVNREASGDQAERGTGVQSRRRKDRAAKQGNEGA